MTSTPMAMTDSIAGIEFSGQFLQSPRCDTTTTFFDSGLWSSATICSARFCSGFCGWPHAMSEMAAAPNSEILIDRLFILIRFLLSV